jgi:hypothetical protein
MPSNGQKGFIFQVTTVKKKLSVEAKQKKV